MSNVRIGQGYDVHRFAADRPLILGGVMIPHTHGLAGHSDADVLLHAITDALLGALALGDIGTHFPDTDDTFAGADSRKLLQKAHTLITDRNYAIANIDATVIAEQPKLVPHINKMRSTISDDLSIDVSQVSIKATTSEKMGFVGRQEGIAAMAIALLQMSN